MKKFLIIGLGNIGSEYHETRHNIGFMIVDALVATKNGTFASDRYASVSTLRHKGRQIILIKPSTYMNLSGKSVRYWLERENIPIENMLVIYDDIDLEPGTIRIKPKGGGGSHNGINHIIEILGTQNFARLRFGIGKNYSQGQQVNYVLEKFDSDESELIKQQIEIAGKAILSFATGGLGNTMNAFNKKEIEKSTEKPLTKE
ncbi:MAG: aminoacyl-tRNA hydrolase [Candidatus Izemoplasmatales bacterium]|nr:aminoacyl-tRNA hydrolase [Bacteroidales bacterium]